MLKKNDIVSIKTENISLDGSGVGHIDGQVVFVPFSAKDDFLSVRIIKVNKSYCVGKIESIIKPSDNRVEPDCPAYGKCGGCVFRHIDRNEENRIKTQGVKDDFRRLGGIDVRVADALCVCGESYRNKAQFPVTEDDKGLHIGFYAGFSHRVVDGSIDCRAMPAEFSSVVKSVRNYMLTRKIHGYNEEKNFGLIRHLYMRINVNGEVMLCVVLNGNSLIDNNVENEFCDYVITENPFVCSIYINVNKKNSNVVLGDEYRLLYGREKFADTLLDTKLEMTPASFYQVNRKGAELIYSTAFNLVNNKKFENVYDLYCGIGSIGICLFNQIKLGKLNIEAKRLIGVEIVESAVECARLNAENNGITNAVFEACDSADITKMTLFDKYPPSLVILDPPRKGCDEKLLQYLSSSGVEYILYISCNPSTLARDVRFLTDRGYETSTAYPVNIFEGTKHVETVVLLSRQYQ